MEIKVSIGEIIDKLTILAIKMERVTDVTKLKNITYEYNYMKRILDEIHFDINSSEYNELYEVNVTLWDIEERLREKDKKNELDDEFIQTARNESIYNDKRAEIKKRINIKYESEIIEEKSYEHV